MLVGAYRNGRLIPDRLLNASPFAAGTTLGRVFPVCTAAVRFFTSVLIARRPVLHLIGARRPIARLIPVILAAWARLLARPSLFALIAIVFGIQTIIEGVTLLSAHQLVIGATALLAQDTKIMIRELKVIFGVDPIALHLRVSRQVAIFLVKLARIAARTVVDAVAGVHAAAALTRIAATIATTTAAAADLPVIYQAVVLEPECDIAFMTSGRCPRCPFALLQRFCGPAITVLVCDDRIT